MPPVTLSSSLLRGLMAPSNRPEAPGSALPALAAPTASAGRTALAPSASGSRVALQISAAQQQPKKRSISTSAHVCGESAGLRLLLSFHAGLRRRAFGAGESRAGQRPPEPDRSAHQSKQASKQVEGCCLRRDAPGH
jgi:hypothetical protein